jgi:hypothetical protein
VPQSIVALMKVPASAYDAPWLIEALQAAIELELSTIPPYLCGLWSIIDPDHEVATTIREIVLEEMGHMGLACNLLTTIGGTPQLNTPAAVPLYPGPLPGGVRPELTVYLSGLTPDLVKDVFLEIETPEHAPVAAIEDFPTIGAFYSAILAAFEGLSASSITGARQRSSLGVGVFPIKSIEDARRAIAQIQRQGEGTAASPFSNNDDPTELAHYYRFKEIVKGHRLKEVSPQQWDFVGAPVPFPSTFPVARVPPGGYVESQAFDTQYTDVLNLLQRAWEHDEQAALSQAIRRMGALEDTARALMQQPRPTAGGNFGPSFLLIAQRAGVAPTTGAAPQGSEYARVLAILDNAIGGPTAQIGVHGPFWRGLTRDQFVAKKVFGLKIVDVGNGPGSNLVRALRGEVPFGADQPGTPPEAEFSRMPAGFPPVQAADITFIEQWINNGCPDTP